jgi:hypothetical protein
MICRSCDEISPDHFDDDDRVCERRAYLNQKLKACTLKKGQSRPPCRSNFISDFSYVDPEGGDKSALFENFVVGLVSAPAQNQNAPIEIEFSENP